MPQLAINPFYTVTSNIRARELAIYALEREGNAVCPAGRIIMAEETGKMKKLSKKALDFLIAEYDFELMTM